MSKGTAIELIGERVGVLELTMSRVLGLGQVQVPTRHEDDVRWLRVWFDYARDLPDESADERMHRRLVLIRQMHDIEREYEA